MEDGENSTGATIVIVVLLGLLILVSGYIVYSKVYLKEDIKQIQNNDQGNRIDNNYELLYINSDFVQSLYKKTNINTNDCHIKELPEGVMRTSEFSNKNLLKLAYSHMMRNGNSSWTEGQLEYAFKDVFGNNATYTPGEFKYDHIKYIYNKEKKEYTFDSSIVTPSEMCFERQHEQITEARKHDNRIEIFTVVFYCSSEGVCYSDKANKNKIDGSDLTDHKNTKGISKYKYTFNNNGNEKRQYYYYSIEKMND